MRTLPFKTIGLLAVLASTCGVAHAADDRPHALPANLLASAGKHDVDPRLQDALGKLERPDLKHEADEDGRDKDRHGGHPCTPD